METVLSSASVNADEPLASSAPSEARVSRAGPIAPLSILIIDPDIQGVQECVRAFGARGWRVELAESYVAALPFLEGIAFDVVLIEMALPDMVGTEAWTCVQRKHPKMTGILTTSSASLHRAINGLSEGAAAYLLKPLDIRFLCALIEQLSEERQSYKPIQPLRERLLGLQTLFSTLTNCSAPEQILEKALAHLQSVLHYDLALLYVGNQDRLRLDPLFTHSVSSVSIKLDEEQAEYVEALARQSMESRKALVIERSSPNALNEKLKFEGFELDSCIAMPLIGQKSVHATLVVISTFNKATEQEPVRIELLAALCQVVAIALDRAYLAKELDLLGAKAAGRALAEGNTEVEHTLSASA